MIKGNCAQSVVPRYGKKSNSFGLLQCPYWSIVRMWWLNKIFITDLLTCVCFESCKGLFHGFEEDSPKDSEKWSWVKNEVVSVVFGAMFGEESVNSSVDLFFSVGCCNSLSLREDFVHDCLTSTGARRHGYAALRTICSFNGTCSYALLLQLAVTDAWVLSNMQSRTPRLLCFWDQHFVASVRIAGLCLVQAKSKLT